MVKKVNFVEKNFFSEKQKRKISFVRSFLFFCSENYLFQKDFQAEYQLVPDKCERNADAKSELISTDINEIEFDEKKNAEQKRREIE